MELPNSSAAGPLHSWGNLFVGITNASRDLAAGLKQMGPQKEGLEDLLELLEKESYKKPPNPFVVNGIIQIISEKFDLTVHSNLQVLNTWIDRMKQTNEPYTAMLLSSAISAGQGE